MMMLKPPGVSKIIQSKRHIVNYMRGNFDSWLEHANSVDSWGLDLRPEQLLFVSGTLKTTQWAVAAFQDGMFRNKSGYVSGQFGSIGNLEFSVNISNQSLPTSYYRFGPVSSNTPPSLAPGGPNQCLFIHYYKMKRRFWWKEPMQAGAGPHQLPPGPNNPGADPMSTTGYEFEAESHEHDNAYDPVTDLLDYILRNSDANTAIASDLDIIALFRDRAFPEDISGALKELSPLIDLDDDGVGTISVDYTFVRKREREDDLDLEATEEDTVKRLRYDEGMSLEYPSIGNYLPNPQHGGDQTSASPSSSWEYSEYGENQPRAMGWHEYTSQQGVASTRYSIRSTPPDPAMHLPTTLAPPRNFPPRLSPPQTMPHGGSLSLQRGIDDEDDTAPESGEKAAGKRPDFGARITVHEGSVTALAYSTDRKYVASGSEDATIIIWDAPNNAARHRVPLSGFMGHVGAISQLAFSPNNVHLASASSDEKLIIWEVESGRMHEEITHNEEVHSIAYTPDGKYLIAGANDGKLLLWHALADTYKPVETSMTGSTEIVTFMVFSPDGSLMATGGSESECYIWETDNIIDKSEPLSVLKGHRGTVCTAAFSPDSRRIITASEDGSSWIWDARSGEALVMMHQHREQVWTVAFSPDGKRVASGSNDSTVKVCDSYSGDCQLALQGHENMVNAVMFSPDGRYIASAAADNTVRVWNAADGTSQATYDEHDDNVSAVVFARDESTLQVASGSHDGTVRIRRLIAVHSE